MLRTTAFSIALTGSLLAGAATSSSAPRGCTDRDAIIDKLDIEYGETLEGKGHTYSGGILEIFRSAEGSWTIIVTTPGIGGDLQSCLLAHGESWESLPARLADNLAPPSS